MLRLASCLYWFAVSVSVLWVIALSVHAQESGLTIQPDPLEVTIAAGSIATEAITLSNNGGNPISFSFPQYQIGNGAIAAAPLAGRDTEFPIHLDRSNPNQSFPQYLPLRGAGGPDAFGYQWMDSNEPGGPIFEPLNIADSGEQLPLGTAISCTEPAYDEGVAQVDLPFDFPFYGEIYDRVWVSVNGFLAFQDIHGCTYGATAFPSPFAPNASSSGAMLAPLWVDLQARPDQGGGIFIEHLPDGRFVVQWHNVSRWNESPTNTFQVILSPNGLITYQYLTIRILGNVLGGPQIGQQNVSGSEGLHIASGVGYAESGLAVSVSTFPYFIPAISPIAGTVNAGSSIDVELTLDATHLIEGTYNGTLLFATDYNGGGIHEYPVTLNVTGEAVCTITPSPIAFGGLPVGAQTTITATISNSGSADCFLENADIDHDAFSVDFSSVTLTPGDATSFEITFAPTAIGPVEAVLTIIGDEPITVNISGSGQTEPEASLPTTSATLLVSPANPIATAILSLTNVGDANAADLEYLSYITAARPEPPPTRPVEAEVIERVSIVDTEGPFPQTEFGSRSGYVELIMDGSFESGTPSPFWDEYSLNFGTVLCTPGCGLSSGTGPLTGIWWAWFGGLASSPERGHVAQQLEIPQSDEAWLSFFLEIPVACQPGWLRVSIDGDLLFEVTENDQKTYSLYKEIVLDVSEYADGDLHEIRFESRTWPLSSGCVTNFFLDDISLQALPRGPISILPHRGEIAQGETADIELRFEYSDDLDVGSYPFELLIETNDPNQPVLFVDVLVVVETVSNEDDAPAQETILHPAFPNPFTDQTVIAFELPQSGQVTLEILDLTGRRVAILVDEVMASGRHEVTWDARGLAGGTYFYRLRTGDYSQTLRTVLVR